MIFHFKAGEKTAWGAKSVQAGKRHGGKVFRAAFFMPRLLPSAAPFKVSLFVGLGDKEIRVFFFSG